MKHILKQEIINVWRGLPKSKPARKEKEGPSTSYNHLWSSTEKPFSTAKVTVL